MKRKNGRNHGEVFTKLNVANYILDEVGYVSSKNLKNTLILEPASGQGSFALEIISRLVESSLNFHFDFIDALNQNVQFVEINEKSFKRLKENIFISIQSFGFPIEDVSNSIFSNVNYLLFQTSSKFDCIVGNPPYIRHEIIDSKLKSIYKLF